MKPILKERAVMVDCGRKYFSVRFFKKLIELMERYRLNMLQLHFSDNEGFRIESETISNVVSKEHLTKREIKEIISIASEANIKIIPELDSPGHLRQILNYYPEFRLPVLDESGQTTMQSGSLNITNADAVQLIKSLIEEYAELFATSSVFHIGADEFIDFKKINHYPVLVEKAKSDYGSNAIGIEPYIDYIQAIAQFVISLGFVPRVWNDGLYRSDQVKCLARLSNDVQITYWTKWDKTMAPVQRFIDLGHKVINYNDNYFYYVLGGPNYYPYPTASLVSQWKINEFSGKQFISQNDMKYVLGCSFAIWSDQPSAETEDDVLKRISAPLKQMAITAWNGNQQF